MTNAAIVKFKDYGGGIREATKRIKWSVSSSAPCTPEDLPFTARDENGHMVWWSVVPPNTDYYAVHHTLGRAYAFELLDLLNNPEGEFNEHILSFITGNMLRSVQRSGDWREATMVEGFFAVVSEYISTGQVSR
ncbi:MULTISPECIES: hypothetical protein [unclassified Burkholderia]|uniref:hypothetical protein n=1 Tax=unclassified Burkholderia TaxID=2613784 RepID=UPI000F5ADD2C|nr:MULTISPECIES: hypothetical protein [unclassified Burkholderia]